MHPKSHALHLPTPAASFYKLIEAQATEDSASFLALLDLDLPALSDIKTKLSQSDYSGNGGDEEPITGT